MRIQIKLLLCCILCLFLWADSTPIATALAFSEAQLYSEIEEQDIDVSNESVPLMRSHYRVINKPREKRFYCGINVDCSKQSVMSKKTRTIPFKR